MTNFEDEGLEDYYKTYDKISYLALRINKIRKSLVSDDLAIDIFMKLVSLKVDLKKD